MTTPSTSAVRSCAREQGLDVAAPPTALAEELAALTQRVAALEAGAAAPPPGRPARSRFRSSR